MVSLGNIDTQNVFGFDLLLKHEPASRHAYGTFKKREE